MLEGYIQWVSTNPILSAAIQFAVLGTLGELLPRLLQMRKVPFPFTLWQCFAKVLAWGILGVVIKYGFVGMRGFVAALLEHGLLPSWLATGLGWASALSVFTNLFFGPQMMLFHRLEDNLILWRWNFQGITKAWRTLLWFWIPAHTITFSLPIELQIGLAAVWSIALGLIMGWSAPPRAKLV